MKGSSIRIKLFLEGLGIEFKYRTRDDLRLIQKAVYIASQANLNLGYHFGWYDMGPYSPELTTALWDLKDELEIMEDKEYEDYILTDGLKELVLLIKPLMTPQIPTMSQVDWLELLASVLYLWNCEYRDKWFFKNWKVREPLRPYYKDAKKLLRKYKLLRVHKRQFISEQEKLSHDE
jgi:uncharacterized protein YwgA